jgi:hypothetical protein
LRKGPGLRASVEEKNEVKMLIWQVELIKILAKINLITQLYSRVMINNSLCRTQMKYKKTSGPPHIEQKVSGRIPELLN